MTIVVGMLSNSLPLRQLPYLHIQITLSKVFQVLTTILLVTLVNAYKPSHVITIRKFNSSLIDSQWNKFILTTSQVPECILRIDS